MSSRALAIGWGVFACLNVAAMAVFPESGEIPFHLVWVSLTLVYAYYPWGPRATAATVAVVSIVTGAVLLLVTPGVRLDVDEIAEIPLMAMMFAAMVWHVSRRRRAMEELHASRRRERAFLRAASHELRTPITVARGHAELLRSEAKGPQAADLDVVLGELERLGTIAERLVALEPSERRAPGTWTRVDLAELVARSARRWPPAAPRDWSFDAANPVLVRADRPAVEAAVDALIDNAVKATHPGDPIAITARRDDDSAVLEVRDGGVGIPAEDQPRIFDPFWHADAGGVGQRGGAGLGLSIVAATVKGHGGSIVAESARGVGTTMTVRIPLDGE